MKLNLMSMEELDKIVRGTAQPEALRRAALQELSEREEGYFKVFVGSGRVRMQQYGGVPV